MKNTSTPLQTMDVSQQNSGNQSALLTYLNDMNQTLWLTVPPVLLVLGCFGNVMTIVVMRALRASDSTACLSVYFTALALSDLCLLLSSALVDWVEFGFGLQVMQVHNAVCTSSFFVLYVTSMTSAWFLMAMTGQRMMSVMMPHRVGVLCTVKRAKVLTGTLTLIACAACAQILFNYRVVEVEDQGIFCQNTDEAAAEIFSLVSLLLSSIIPFLFLLVANCVLIRGVLQSVKMSRVLLRRDDGHQPTTTSSPSAKVSSMTVTLILTSVAFLVLSIPICISDIYMEEVGVFRGQIEDEVLVAQLTVIETVALLLWLTNSVVNFYLYVLSGRKFREETKRCLCLPFKVFEISAASTT